MKYLVKLEELSLFGLALFLFSQLDYGWGTYALLFLAPDLSMIGYLTNTRLGAWTYNLIHHKGVSVALYISGFLLSVPWLMFAGTLLLGHSSLDRVFGYGLKHEDAFQNTHLGKVGRLNAMTSGKLGYQAEIVDKE
ncbi:MAG TPA: DUF4260 domain-containing protein [Anaerolineales bacterium]|nr:DUF4260 domain-containing protein [Anaerolineales bacterium]